MDSIFDMKSLSHGLVCGLRERDKNLPNTEEEEEDQRENYTILSELDIKRLQEDAINKVASVLCIPDASACFLLCHNLWNVTKVLESWCEDEEKVQKAAGLLNQPKVEIDWLKDLCQVCFRSSEKGKILSAGCAHPLCEACWMDYIDTNINKGPSKCLTLRCPDPSCDVAVDRDMIRKLASESSKVMYEQFLLWSYVDSKAKMRWCPAPGCDYVVCYQGDGGCARDLDVTCLCYHSFCWRCGEESHSPVDCETAGRWMKKIDKSTSENGKWILAHTKPCPRCKSLIEKNQGFKYMTCKCGFQFCWVCFHEQLKCESRSCSPFIRMHIMEFQGTDGEEVEINMEKDNPKKCNHYYECWARNDFLSKSILQKLIDLDRKYLSMSLQKRETYFDFVKKAWQQIAECRRILKWTNVYGYFLPKNEKAKKQFSEYIQVEAEVALEKLQQCAKVEETMFQDNYPEESLNKFQEKVIHLTDVTKIYFENLLRAFEDGLDKVEARMSIK